MYRVSDWIVPLVYRGLCHQHEIASVGNLTREQEFDDLEVENDVSNLYLCCRRRRCVQLLEWEEGTRENRARVADLHSTTSAVFTKAAISKWQQNFKSFTLRELRTGAVFLLEEYEIRLPNFFEKPRVEIWIRGFEIVNYDGSCGSKGNTFIELKDSLLIQPLLELRRPRTSAKKNMTASTAYGTFDQSPSVKSQASCHDLGDSDGGSCGDSDKENHRTQAMFATQAPFTQPNSIDNLSPLHTQPIANSKNNAALLRLIGSVQYDEQDRALDPEGQAPESSKTLANAFKIPSHLAPRMSPPKSPSIQAYTVHGSNITSSSQMKSDDNHQTSLRAPITSVLRGISSDRVESLVQEPGASMQASSCGSIQEGDDTPQSPIENHARLGHGENTKKASGRSCSNLPALLKIHLINDRYLPRYLHTIPKEQRKLLNSDDKWQPPLVGKTERPGTVPLELLNRLTEAADSPQISMEDLIVVAIREENGDVEDVSEAGHSIVLTPNVLESRNTQSYNTSSEDEVPWSQTPRRPARNLPPDSSPSSSMQPEIRDARANMNVREEPMEHTASPELGPDTNEIEATQKSIQVSRTPYVANNSLTKSLLDANQVDLAHIRNPSLQKSFDRPGLSPPSTPPATGTFQEGIELHSESQILAESDNKLPEFELDSSEDADSVDYENTHNVMETINDIPGGSVSGEPASHRNEESRSGVQSDNGRMSPTIIQRPINPTPKMSKGSPAKLTSSDRRTEGRKSLKRKLSPPHADMEHQKCKKTVLDKCFHSDCTADFDFSRSKMMIRQDKRQFHDAMKNQPDALAVSFSKFGNNSVESIHTATIEAADTRSSLQLSTPLPNSISTPLTVLSDYGFMPNRAVPSDSSQTSRGSIERLQSLLTSFQQGYPSYKGSLTQFSKACLMLKRHLLEGKSVPQCLWDDFIFRHHHDYRKYVLQVADSEELESVLSYEKFYDELKAKPEYLEQIVTSQSLRALEAEISSAPSSAHASTLASRRLGTTNEINGTVSTSSLVSNIRSHRAELTLAPKPYKAKVIESFRYSSRQYRHQKDSKRGSSSVKLWLEKASGAESPELGTPHFAEDNVEVPPLDISQEGEGEEVSTPVSTMVQGPSPSVQFADNRERVVGRRKPSPKWWHDPHTTFTKFLRAHVKLDAHDQTEVQIDGQGLLRAEVHKAVDIFSWR